MTNALWKNAFRKQMISGVPLQQQAKPSKETSEEFPERISGTKNEFPEHKIALHP